MSEAPRFRLEPLGPQHDRRHFSCGNAALDRYLREQAGQDQRRHLARCFLLIALDTGQPAGYFTLSAYAIAPADLPAEERRGLPAYDLVPAVLIGRLALDRALQGVSLTPTGTPRVTIASVLLHEALAACLTLAGRLGLRVVVVDAKDARAIRFYQRHGFLAFHDRPDRPYLPIATIARLPGMTA